MKTLRPLAIGIIPLILFASCATSRKGSLSGMTDSVSSLGAEIMENLSRIPLLTSGGLDLFYCAASFQNKRGRFPEDFAELQEFIRQSDGYLALGQYERVVFQPLPQDGLEIRYVRTGRTNEMKFTLGGSPANR